MLRWWRKVPGPAESPHTFTLNTRPVTVSAADDEPLLYVLRDRLNLPGTRFGCGVNQCGACRVLIDNRGMAACDTPMWSVAGRTVITIEGLAESPTASRLQRSFEALQAGQCGACLSGIIVTLTQAIDSGAAHDEPSARRILDAQLCRCGSHSRIVAAALSALASPARQTTPQPAPDITASPASQDPAPTP
jgi:nicotinate dehydrogenase subunit A